MGLSERQLFAAYGVPYDHLPIGRLTELRIDMPFITVNAGSTEVADGVYPVILTEITGPKLVTAQRGPKAGQEIELLDWIFVIDNDGGEFDQIEVKASTSTASGPKSKMYSYLTALLGGKPPAVGQSFEITDLAGRRALATIRNDESGWPRIENLGAIPASMLQQSFAQATGTPTRRPVANPTRGATAVADRPADDLPF